MSGAFSPCRTWRYVLTRETESKNGGGTVTFIGLNPSTADEIRDDPTTRRCIRFAREWSFARLELVNLFAFRATRPEELRRALDPVGPGNFAAIRRAVERSDLVVCAWGNHGLGPHADDTLGMLVRPHCLGLTAKGAPRHPLYVCATSTPRPFVPPLSSERLE